MKTTMKLLMLNTVPAALMALRPRQKGRKWIARPPVRRGGAPRGPSQSGRGKRSPGVGRPLIWQGRMPMW